MMRSSAIFISRISALVGLLWLGCTWPAGAFEPWESIGPNGGDRFEFKISPADPQTVFSMGYHAVHRSRDGAESWTLVNNAAMSSDTFHDLAFADALGQQIFVAGEAKGIWFSADEGTTWSPRSSGLPFENGDGRYFPVTSLLQSPAGALFAAFGSGRTSNPPSLVYQSLDAGQNWTPAQTGLTTPPGRTETLLSMDGATQMWAMVYGVGVFHYAGGTWINRNGNLPTNASLKATYLAHDPNLAGRALLGTEDAWVYETINGGTTWSAKPKPEELENLAVLPLVYTIVIDPNNSNFVLVRANDAVGSREHPLFPPRTDQTAGAGLYASVDGGATWGRRSLFAFRLACNPEEVIEDVVPGVGLLRRTKTWYRTAGGRDSILKSTNGTVTFDVKIQNLRTVWMNDIFADPTPPAGYTSLVYAASEDGLFLMSNRTAGAWSYGLSAQSALYTWSFAKDHANPGGVYYGMGSPAWNTPEKQGIYRIGLDCFDASCVPEERQILVNTGVWRVVTTPAHTNRIYAGCQQAGVLFSDDGGATWQPRTNGLAMPASVTDLILTTNGNPLFAAVRTANGTDSRFWPPQDKEAGGVYQFNNGSGQWSLLPDMTSAVYALQFVTAPTATLYAATSEALLKYTAGEGWQTMKLPILINDVLLDPTRPGHIYAATRVGIFRSTSGGEQWHDFSTGLPVRVVYAIERDPTDGTLYAGLEGGSVQRMLPDPNPVPRIAALTNVNFGTVPVGFNKNVEVTITNVGEANLVITGFSTNSAQLSVTNVPALPAVVTPGGWITVYLRFAPTGTAPFNGQFTITGNATNAPFVIRAQGQGYTEKGTLSIVTDPQTAPWIMSAPWGSTTGRLGNLPPVLVPTGTYSVAWFPVDGYALPTNQPGVVFVGAGQTVQVQGLYRAILPGTIALAQADTTVSESDGQAVIQVARTGGSDGTVTVQYATAANSAQAGVDYATVSGTLTFDPGQTNASFTVPIIADSVSEGQESFGVALTNPGGGASLGSPQAGVVRIADTPGILQFSSEATAINEGNVNVTFTVLRSGGAGGQISVDFATSNGTATAGLDYAATNGTLVFTDGQLSRTFAVRVLEDAVPEADETAVVRLANATGGAAVGPIGAATLTIADGVDTDQDGLPDWWELQYFGNSTNAPPAGDPDGDALANTGEYGAGTDPLDPDTDNDGFSDQYEIQRGSDPLTPTSFPLIIISDFDGDRKSDIGVFYEPAGNWYIRSSIQQGLWNGAAVGWGPTAKPFPGDFDGDRRADLAVFQASDGKWYIRQSSTGTMLGGGAIVWGPGAIPVPADYDGDGKDDLAVYAPVDGKWYIRQSSTGTMFGGGAIAWGPGSTPVPGDYDGDGKADLAVYASVDGKWYIRQSSNGLMYGGGPIVWGPGAIPVPGDYDGDARMDLAIYAPVDGKWYVLQSSNNTMMGGAPVTWGHPQAHPVQGDYDGDGKWDIAVYVSLNGKWYVRQSTNGQLMGGGSGPQGGIKFGQTGVTPVPVPYQTLRAQGKVP